jgi:hypothetical protein
MSTIPANLAARSAVTVKRVFIGAAAAVLGIGLVAGLGVLLVAGIFAVTRPVVEASEQFLALLGNGKIAEAYASAADGLRAQQDEASFARAVQQLALTEYSSVSWHNREIRFQEGIAEGTVTVKNGLSKNILVQLVHEQDKWKVAGIRFGGVELATAVASTSLPPAAELEQMVTATLLDFNEAVQAKDFTGFYGTLSAIWRNETTPAKLRTVFKEFVDKNIDLSLIKGIKPQLAPATAVNDDGLLVVTGDFPTQPSQIQFELKYAHERAGWKLIGIWLDVSLDEAIRVSDSR